MKMLNNLVISAGLLAFTASAQATLLNFQALADGSVGESGWTTFNTATDTSFPVNIDITAGDNKVYFDAGIAGLGVCSSGLKSAEGANPFSGTNVCNVGADDNVDVAGEALTFTFNESTSLNGIWFNNNDDFDYSLTGDTVTFSLNGATAVEYMFTAADALDKPSNTTGLGWLFTFDLLGIDAGMSGYFNAGDDLTIAYGGANAEEFYISAIEVPEPAIVALLGMGLVGIGFARRKKA